MASPQQHQQPPGPDSDDWDDVDPEQQQQQQSGGLLAQRDEWSPSWKATAPRHILHRLASALRHSGAPSRPAAAKMKTRPTAYLDGLRGFACLVVYFHHHELLAHWKRGQGKQFESGFGHDGEYHLVAFPFVRNLFSGGHFAVSIFFVMSGYVLSLRMLQLIQAGDVVQLGDHLASALFRRWIRLFLPLAATLAVYATLMHSFGGIQGGSTAFEKQGSWRAEMWHLYCAFKNFSFVFDTSGDPFFPYNGHLWSIPVEFRGSVVVYTSLAALSRCSRNARLWCLAGLLAYFLYVADGAHYAFFCAGVLLCDLDLLAQRGDLPRWIAAVAPYKGVLAYHALAASLYLGGVPSASSDVEDLQASRGWYLLSLLKPQAVFDYKWFYLFWAAAMFVASVPHIRWLRRFFELAFCQYLGRVSFALYLVHGPILAVVGERLYTATGFVQGNEPGDIAWWADRLALPGGPLGLELAFVAPHVVLLPLTLLVADLVTRGIDTPSVRFAAWLYRQTLGDVAGKTKA